MSSIDPKTFTARNDQQITIRTAQADDAAAMLAYIRAVAGETEFFILQPDEFPETEEQERKWIQDHLDHPGQIVLLAEASGTIIGNVSFENGPHRRIAHRGTLGISYGPRERISSGQARIPGRHPQVPITISMVILFIAIVCTQYGSTDSRQAPLVTVDPVPPSCSEPLDG